MPLSSTTKSKQFDLKLVGAHKAAGAEHALKNGNWWTFSGKIGWIIADVGGNVVAPVSFFSLKSTNREAAVKSFKVEALIESNIQGGPANGSVSDEEYCTSHNEAWQVVLDETVDRVPDPPVEYNFAPVHAKFWRVSFLDNFGASWVGVNRIILGGSIPVVNSVLHGGVHDQHRAVICNGVEKVYRSGTPGTIALFGADSFPIFGPPSNGGLESVACAGACIAPSGGKVVAFAHNGYIVGPGFTTKPLDKDEDSQFVQLLSQLLRWCGNSEASDSTIPIAFLGGYKNHQMNPLKELMAARGVQIECVFTGGSILINDVNKAINSGAKIIFFYCNNGKNLICGPDDERVRALRSFILNGGAFITGICPWGWLQTAGNGDLRTNFLLNHVLSIGGMVLTHDYLGGNGSLSVVSTQCPSTHEGHCHCFSPHLGESVLALREAQRTGGSIGGGTLRALCADLAQLPVTIHTNIALDLQQRGQRMAHEADDGSFAFCSLINQTICGNRGCYPPVQFPANCGEGEAIKAESALGSVAIALNQTLWLASSPQSCPPAPALEFPGVVEPHCQRISGRVLDVSVGTERWQSTGLYVPPGECCTLQMLNDENSAALSIPPQFRVRIGCHTDRLNDKPTVNRWPDISISMAWDPSVCDDASKTCQSTLCAPKSGCQTSIASPYGGLLYLEVENWKKYGVDERSTRVKVTVTGAVKAPWFALDREDGVEYTDEELENQRLVLRFPRSNSSLDGYDNNADWKTRLNECDAPWGELEGNFVILSLPLECLRAVQDPVAVLKYWDTVVSNECRIAHQTLNKKERLVCDRQIGGGYMHSGYPVMAHLDICTAKNGEVPRVVNLDILNRDGSWGVYHEFGHNRQCREWTFDGTGEVTVNIFSLYSCFKILNQKPYETDWFGGAAMRNCAKYIEESSQTFENSWKESPAIALGTYASFIQRYGFDVISDIFLVYDQMEAENKPKSDQDKITEWVKQTSVAVQKDLRPYYRTWKWPFDNEKLDDILSAFPEDDWSNLVEELKFE